MKQHICSGCVFNGKVTWCQSEEYQCVPEIFDDIEDISTIDVVTPYVLTPEIQKLVDESSNRTGWIF